MSPPCLRIACAMCAKPVDSWVLSETVESTGWTVRVQCHGERDECFVSIRDVQAGGPGADWVHGIAFGPKIIAEHDDDENPRCDDCNSKIGRDGCRCPIENSSLVAASAMARTAPFPGRSAVVAESTPGCGDLSKFLGYTGGFVRGGPADGQFPYLRPFQSEAIDRLTKDRDRVVNFTLGSRRFPVMLPNPTQVEIEMRVERWRVACGARLTESGQQIMNDWIQIGRDKWQTLIDEEGCGAAMAASRPWKEEEE